MAWVTGVSRSGASRVPVCDRATPSSHEPQLTFLAHADGREVFVEVQQFPLSLQGECSPCELHWHFVNLDAKIPPDLNDVMLGFDHGAGHPVLLVCNAKAPNYRKN